MKVREILKDNSEWIPNKNYDAHNPKISVLLPTFRRARNGFFERAVMSVLNQTFKDLELIIIDDASTDGTKDLIKYFMETDERVHCIRHKENVGLPAISEYEGYMKSRGEYIAFIFDDNEWDKEYIQKTLLFMIREKVKASFGTVKLYYGEKENEYISLGEEKNKNEMNAIFRTNFIGNAGVILHKEVIENVGLYDPHVSLKRICDWDLWIRVFQKYDLEFTNIESSTEHGFKLEDSLGNTENLDLWVGLEQMSFNRDELLKPCNFLEYDIFKLNNNSTELFVDTVEKEIKNYENKYWLNKENNFYDKITELKSNRNRKEKKRIVVVSDSLDATLNVSFLRYKNILDDVIFRLENSVTLTKEMLVYSDAFIFLRKLKAYDKIIQICKEIQIPYYYYIDDNFIILEEDFKKSNINFSKSELKEINEMSIETNQIYKYGFNKIFCSTETLKDFFIKKEMHKNIEVLSPIIDFDNIFNYNSVSDKNISIAFMGGSFRNEILLKIVLPAIIKLSKEIKINFYYPKNSDKTKDIGEIYKENKEINFIGIEKSLSLLKILRKYSKEKIDILIHCGGEIGNNIYKTENSLLNSVQLGAVLITSNIEPYKSIFDSKNEYIRAENTTEDWYEKLKELSLNKEKRIEIYKKAESYCRRKYSGEKEKEIFKSICNELKKLEYIDFIKKYRFFFETQEGININNNDNFFIDKKLNFSGLIEKSRSYNIRCNINEFKSLGLLFASYGEPKGHVVVRILEKNIILRESSFEMENFIKDSWTYIDFDPINNSLNKIYEIELEFLYEKNSVRMGVFENTENRDFKYKLFNKIRCPIKGLDVLFVNCK